LLLKAAAAFGGDYDARMDRYRYVIEALAADDYRRLRSYHQQARSSFTAWLTVVSRRLCVDFDRNHHGRGGRARMNPEAAEAGRKLRRRIYDGAGADVDIDLIPAGGLDPESSLAVQERHEQVQSIVAELEPRDRLLLRLRFDDELPASRIAHVLHLPTVFHVYRRLNTVLRLVRARLEQRGIDSS
jgi:RNA polymerase sigma factor (sigma-70 family)